MTVSLQQLNGADQQQFVAAVGLVFEGSPHLAAQAWQGRPFESVDELYQALVGAMWAAPEMAQLALIAAHPDLAGKASVAGALTTESSREQRSAGLDSLMPDEYARFTNLNDAYKRRFGFPFIICVREHTKASILAQFEERLEHSPEQERQTALGEIAKVARLRLLDMLGEN